MSDTPLFDQLNAEWARARKELPEIIRRLAGVPAALNGPRKDLAPRPRPVPTEPAKPSAAPVLREARRQKRSGNPAKRARAAEVERLARKRAAQVQRTDPKWQAEQAERRRNGK